MKPETVLVTGDRTWDAKHIIMQVLQELKPSKVIQGGALGADTLARMCAAVLKIPCKEYVAEWNVYGRAAGPKRNKQMLDDGKPDLVVAFHDNLEKSKGTKNMIMIANRHGVPVHLYNSKGEVYQFYQVL